MNRCGACRAQVLVYDFDHDLGCYMGPALVDPTPLTRPLAEACVITRRPLYTHTRNRVGRRHMSRVWPRRPIPDGHILPAHQCGAHIPSTLPPLHRTETPTVCPF